MCVFGICMSAPVCRQVKMFIHVQTLKVAKGQKCGAFVQLAHLPHLHGFVVVTAGEINFVKTSLNVFCPLLLFKVTTKQVTVVQQGRHRNACLTVSC